MPSSVSDSQEIWTWVHEAPGFEDVRPCYEISNIGRLRSWVSKGGRKKLESPKILHPAEALGRYQTVLATINQRRRGVLVHSLVAAAFIGPRPPGASILHLNDIATDNRVENLTYGTHRQNALDRVRNRKSPGILNDEQVGEIRLRARAGESFMSIATDLGVGRDTIGRAAKGSSYRHLNFLYPPIIQTKKAGKSTAPRLLEAEREFVEKRLNKGASPKQIEEESGITVASIREYMISEFWDAPDSRGVNEISLSKAEGIDRLGDDLREIWREIPQEYFALKGANLKLTAGRYDVSNHGNVRSCVDSRGRITTIFHLLKPTKVRKVYLYYMLSAGGKQMFCQAHALVAWAFLGPPPPGADRVRHLDDDPSNNHASNLAWGDAASNAADVPYDKRGRRTDKHRIQEVEIQRLRKTGLSRVEIARELSLSPSYIALIEHRLIVREGGVVKKQAVWPEQKQERDQKILQMHKNGLSRKNIAKEVNVTYQYLSKILRELLIEEEKKTLQGVDARIEHYLKEQNRASS